MDLWKTESISEFYFPGWYELLHRLRRNYIKTNLSRKCIAAAPAFILSVSFLMGPRASQLCRLVGTDLTGAEGVDHSLSGWIGWFKLCQRAIKEMFDEEQLENKIILSHVNVTRRCSLLPLVMKGKQLAPAGSCGMVLSWRLTVLGQCYAQQGRAESQIQSGPCGITKLLGQTLPKRPFTPFSKQLGDGAAQWPGLLGVMPVEEKSGRSMLDSDVCESKGKELRIGQGEPRLQCRFYKLLANPTGRFRVRHDCWGSLILTERPRPW